MAGDGNVTLASNVLGTIATVLWCIQLIPQIWYNWKRKDTEGVPQVMMLLWASCAVPMGAYLILQQVNLPLQIQPQIFGFFALVSWGQILYYTHHFPLLRVVVLVPGTAAVFGAIEAALILGLRIPYKHGVTWPDLLVGIIAAILLAAGLLPPYFELWKRGGRVIGLTAQGTFDVLGGIMYLIVVLLEAGIFLSHIIWRIRYRKLLREAKTTGRSIDELLEERQRMEKESEVGLEKVELPMNSFLPAAPVGAKRG
ncbi:hypothetical protein ARAM_007018 [Aspergillus rambellii]|uniref:PQ loop repeat protein n=1 Tax=Aspergillus rambellii TaxID=308745 RepID=A0A0F8U3I4_9EURO|nr:hypothetical protein ARAM_007018 [Aspergillus rambellii]